MVPPSPTAGFDFPDIDYPVSLYDAFNAVEAALWCVVAGVILLRTNCESWQQRGGALLGGAAFLVFGVTDLCEIGQAGNLPIWLWSLKIACGFAILVARFTWLGWSHFSWRSREFVFGLGCLTAVVLIIALQRWLETIELQG